MSWELYTIIGILGFGFLVYVAVRSGDVYPPERAEKEAESYAGIIEEAKGRVTPLLYIIYVVTLVWSIYYLYLHSHEFFLK